MLHPIPIHNAIHLYTIVAFVLIALSTQPVVGLLHARWFVNLRIKVITASAFYKGLIVAWGLCLVPIPALFGHSFLDGLVFAIVGIGLGWCVAKIEKNFVRRFFRHQFFRGKKAESGNQLGSLLSGSVVEPVSLSLSSRKSKKISKGSGIRRGSNNLLIHHESYEFAFLPTLLIAVFEEFIFRGFLVWFCLLLPSDFYIVLSISFVTFAFSLSHVSFGFLQVLLKTIFSFVMLISFFVSGNVICAVIAHLIFNVLAWRHLKGRSMINMQRQANQISILG